MTRVEDQSELALARTPVRAEMPIEMIRAKKTSGAAFTLACDASGLEDKEIYLNLIQDNGKPLDAGYFSNIKKGKATLQADLIRPFCKLVGNTIYPEWIAYQVESTLVMIMTEAERRAIEAVRRAEAAEAENRLMRDLLTRRAAA